MRYFLVVMLLLVLISLPNSACSINSLEENETNEAQEFADAFIAYAQEVILAEDIAVQRLNSASDLLVNGEINTIEFRKRCYQTNLIHAYTLHYIDSKPQYEILWIFLYDKEEPPSLAWSIPELEKDAEAREAQYESYLQSYIDYHYHALSEAVNEIGAPE